MRPSKYRPDKMTKVPDRPVGPMLVPAFQLPVGMASVKALEFFKAHLQPESFKLHGYRYEPLSGVFFAMGEDFQG